MLINQSFPLKSTELKRLSDPYNSIGMLLLNIKLMVKIRTWNFILSTLTQMDQENSQSVGYSLKFNYFFLQIFSTNWTWFLTAYNICLLSHGIWRTNWHIIIKDLWQLHHAVKLLIGLFTQKFSQFQRKTLIVWEKPLIKVIQIQDLFKD